MAAQHPDPAEMQRLFDDVADTLRPVYESFAEAIRALHTALGGDEGIQRIIADLATLAGERTQWETDHPGLRYGQPCHCLCARWNHTGVCTGDADALTTLLLLGERVNVPMCNPCSTHIARLARTPGAR